MSYILEALKKSEQERNLGHVPSINTAHSTAYRPRARPRWFWPLIVIVLINAVLLYALFSYDPEIPGTPTVAMAPETMIAPAPALPEPVIEQSEVPAPRMPAPPAPQPPIAAPVSRPVPPAPAIPPPRPPVSRPIPAAPPVAVAMPRPEPVVAPPPPPPVIPQAEVTSPPVAVEPEVPPLGTVWRDGRDEMRQDAENDRVPELRELSESARQDIPALSLDVHVYTEDRPRRFVLVNLEKYREGDVMKEGPRVEEITPTGVVLSYKSKTFNLSRP